MSQGSAVGLDLSTVGLTDHALARFRERICEESTEPDVLTLLRESRPARHRLAKRISLHDLVYIHEEAEVAFIIKRRSRDGVWQVVTCIDLLTMPPDARR